MVKVFLLSMVILGLVGCSSVPKPDDIRITLCEPKSDSIPVPDRYEFVSPNQLFFFTNSFNAHGYLAQEGYFVEVSDSACLIVHNLVSNLLAYNGLVDTTLSASHYLLKIEVLDNQQNRKVYMFNPAPSDTLAGNINATFRELAGQFHRYGLKQPYTFSDNLCQPKLGL